MHSQTQEGLCYSTRRCIAPWRAHSLVILTVLCAGVVCTPRSAAAQSTTITCTDSTNTNCTAKKNQPFGVTNDPALATDVIPTEKWRLYVDGVKVNEQAAIPGTAPLYDFPSGLAVVGEHTIYVEAVGTAFDASGQPVEVASGPSNVAKLTIVTGNLSAPKNLHIVK